MVFRQDTYRYALHYKHVYINVHIESVIAEKQLMQENS